MTSTLFKARLFALIIFCFLLTSCTSAIFSGAGLGVSYTLANVAYKTINHPISNVDDAMEQALNDLDMEVLGERGDYPIKKIDAATFGLEIRITLTEITSRATQIRVDARKDPVRKDRATAVAVIERVERILDEGLSPYNG